MRKIAGVILLMIATGSAMAQGVPPKGNATYSAVDQFSSQKNPNGAWAYGYTATLGSPLIKYTIKGSTCCSNQVGWFGPFGPAPGYPLLLENATGSTQSLDMDPGPDGEYSIVRWTVPSTGTWDIVGDFQGTGTTTTDAHILQDGAPIFDAAVNASDVHNFGLTLKLKAGETIDFAVGFGGAFGGDPTGFQAVVSSHLYDFQEIDFPGATETLAYSLNDLGVVVGQYTDGQGNGHGFTYSKRNGYKSFDYPGAVLTGGFSINNLGNIVGIYIDTNGVQHGFLLAGNHFVPLNVPGAVNTNALGINDQGNIVGVYDNGDPAVQIGFVLKNGHYTTIENPLAPPMQTQLNDINDCGQIVGVYTDTAGMLRGFLLDQGKFTPIDFPDTTVGTIPYGINQHGQISGRYLGGSGGNEGFVLLKGDYEPIAVPGSSQTAGEQINDAGQVAGFYRVPGSSLRHGFVATPGKTAGR